MVVVRPIPCFISAALMGGVVMTMARANHSTLKDYVSQLTPGQLQAHKKISDARLRIWLTGLGLGLVAAWFVAPRSGSSLMRGCTFAAIAMLINYFYYMLAPKPGYMIEVLRQDQVPEWLAVKKMMQSSYHIGMLVGVLALYLLGLGVM